MNGSGAPLIMEGNCDLTPFKELMLRTCGLSFEKDREQTLAAALIRRMKSQGIDTPEAYHAQLIRDRDELLRLVELLTVNETYFFREPEYLKLMADKLLPEYLKERQSRPIRILSAGCSSGEEPYSLAMMLWDRYGTESERLFSITGVDIDSSVIAGARQGVYGKGSFRGMELDLLERHFEPCGPGKMQVRENIKRQVGFEVVNLRGAFYPHGMHLPDFIFYRNVSIYFPQQVQHEIFSRLAGLLTEGGYLFVGASETIQHDIGLLSLVERDALFFFRKTPVQVFEERRGPGRHTVVAEQVRGKTKAIPTVAPETKFRREHQPVSQAPWKKHTGHSPADSAGQETRTCFDTALGLAHDNRADEALEALDAIIERDNSFVKAYSLKGSLLLSTARYEEARAACGSALGLDPLCLEGSLMLGIIERHEGNEEEAFKRFREAIYLDPSCWLAHFYTAEIQFGRGEKKRAVSSYEAALRILKSGSLKEHGQAFFPLSFNAEQFSVICRHKLSLLKENG